MTMASMLAAALIGSSMDSGGDAAVGLATAAQAAGAQRQINFTRAHEYEADRIGMGVLSQAGFDPTGMASFFEKLSRRESTSLDLIPEMLRTHPTSSGRIAEARGRARQLPPVSHVDSLGYGLAKARIRVLTARTPEQALEYYQRRDDSPDPADRYGLALSLMGIGLNDTAGQIFRDLSRDNPSVIAFRIGQAEALMADGLDDEAIAVYREANTLSPRNIPLVVSFGEALLRAGRAEEAHRVLLDLLNNVDNATPAQIELLARAADAEGDRINAHHYMAEYFASVGNLSLAMNQLRTVLSLPDLNRVQRARFEARLAQFQEYLDELDG
jgi:predicted Zn-dependent protease